MHDPVPITANGGWHDGASPASRYRRTVHPPLGVLGPEEVSPPSNSLPPESVFRGDEQLPDPLGGDFRGAVEPFFGEIIDGEVDYAPPVPRPGFLEQFVRGLRESRRRGGIGRERLAFAPLEIESAQPANMLSMRFESVYDLKFPDRAEYFWARSGALAGGKGPPLFEPSVDYQDLRMRVEAGGAKFSATTEMALRTLNPVNNANTSGMGDMNVGTKLVMIDGDNTQIASVFRTYILTGVPGKGLGTGHVSLEPGLLFRHTQSDLTWWHGELKMWIPIAGDPNQAGEVLRYGVGVSSVLYDSDRLAILPVAELGGLVFLSGQKSVAAGPGGTVVAVDGENAINFLPGLRFVLDNGGDLGLTEIGVGGGFTLGSSGWYDGMMRAEMRMSF